MQSQTNGHADVATMKSGAAAIVSVINKTGTTTATAIGRFAALSEALTLSPVEHDHIDAIKTVVKTATQLNLHDKPHTAKLLHHLGMQFVLHSGNPINVIDAICNAAKSEHKKIWQQALFGALAGIEKTGTIERDRGHLRAAVIQAVTELGATGSAEYLQWLDKFEQLPSGQTAKKAPVGTSARGSSADAGLG